jgi:hypothetical protein
VQYTIIIKSISPSTQLYCLTVTLFSPLHVSVSSDHLQVVHKNVKLNYVAFYMCDVFYD